MSKAITNRDGPVFGISSSLELFEKLKYDSIRLQEKWHPFDAFNFLVTAWHLFEDWGKSDVATSLSRIKRQRKKLPEPMNLVLYVARDLVNGSKHFQLSPEAANNRLVTEVHTGEERDWYEYFFHEDIPAVTAKDDWYFSIRILHNLLMAYFQWVFDDSIPVKSFPDELMDAITYCHIPTRRHGPSPSIWLKGYESAFQKARDEPSPNPSEKLPKT